MKKNLSIFLIGLTTIGACAVFATTLVQAAFHHEPEPEISPSEAQVHTPARYTTGAEAPARLSIPAIKVDAGVQDVGIARSGRMGVPSNYTDVGWYRYGPAPGQVGSAVMDGHVDNGFGLNAVFKDITTLAVGDEIFVTTNAGEKLHFVVREVATYAANEVPLERIFNRTDGTYLNLITCAGDWDKDNKSYDERTVVYTELLP